MCSDQQTLVELPSEGVSPLALLWGEWASLIAQLVKNLPVMQETPDCFLSQEAPLEKG